MNPCILRSRVVCICFFACLVLVAQSAWAGSHVIDTAQYTKKIDNFLILIDSSESMNAMHNGTSKLTIAKDIVSRMNQTLPDLPFVGGMRTFGRGYGLFSINQSKLLSGMTQHDTAVLDAALCKITFPAGNTALGTAIRAAGSDLQGVQGNMALIIVSDGISTQKGSVDAVRALKQQYGDQLCIYPIVVGTAPEGIHTMRQIAIAGDCGFMTIGDRLQDDGRMRDFVVRVFLMRKAPAKMAISVPVRPAPVPQVLDKIVLRAIQFEFDSAAISAEYYPILDEAVSILSSHTGKKIKVEGHTCSMGPENYNMGLSKRRAESVAKYLGTQGIPEKTFVIEPHGESNPVADNTTRDGRRKNRRVELKVVQ
jgi:OmpA-OmpF porin, OOP family